MTAPRSPADVTAEDFCPFVDRQSRIPGWPDPLTLVRVDAQILESPAGEAVGRRPFSLIFQGPPKTILREGFYTLEFEDAAAFNLYIMPIHTVHRDRQDYQAVFN